MLQLLCWHWGDKDETSLQSLQRHATIYCHITNKVLQDLRKEGWIFSGWGGLVGQNIFHWKDPEKWGDDDFWVRNWRTGTERERGQQCQRQELHGCRVVLRRGPVAGVGSSGPRAWEGRQGLDCQRSSVPPALWLKGPGEGFLSWRMAWFDLGCVRRLWGSVEGRAARPQTGQRGPKSGGLDPRLMGSLGPEHVDFRYPVTEGNQTGKKSMA